MGFLHVSGNEPQIALLADISELCLASRGELQQTFILTSSWSQSRVIKGKSPGCNTEMPLLCYLILIPSSHPPATCLFCQITSMVDGLSSGRHLASSQW